MTSPAFRELLARVTLLAAVLIAPALAHAQLYPNHPTVSNPTYGWSPTLNGGIGGYGPFTLDTDHNLNVNCVAGCGSGSSGPTNVTIVGPDGPKGGVSVSVNPYRQNGTNRGASMTVGGSWQQVSPTNPLRQRFFLQNYCSAATQGIASTESLFLAFSPDMPTYSPLTAPGAVELLTCGSYDSSYAIIGTAPVWVWAATAGHRFGALEW